MYICVHICMCVCVCVCIYIYVYICVYICIHTYIQTYIYLLCVCVYTHKGVSARFVRVRHLYNDFLIHTHTHTHTHTHKHTHICVCMYVCMYVRMYVCPYKGVSARFVRVKLRASGPASSVSLWRFVALGSQTAIYVSSFYYICVSLWRFVALCSQFYLLH